MNVKVGLIRLGRLAKAVHIEALRKIAGVTILAVADI